MKTLKEFSKSNPSNYQIEDKTFKMDFVRNWEDAIQITCKLTWKTYTFTRKRAFNKGLCLGIN